MPDTTRSSTTSIKIKLTERIDEPLKFLPILFIVFIIWLLYCIYVGCHLLELIYDEFHARRGARQFFVFNFFVIMMMASYVQVVLIHPGEVPVQERWNLTEDRPVEIRRQIEDVRQQAQAKSPGSEERLELEKRLNLLKMKSTSRDDLLATRSEDDPKEVEVKRGGERRFCKWCQRYKPDRCHHCRVCRTCILKMDHHCPWIYNCVGLRNQKFFFLFILYSACACQYIFWTMMGTVGESLDMTTSFIRMFLLLFGESLAGLIGFLVGMFCIFHIVLISQNMTTLEFCEKTTRRAHLHDADYDRGMVLNISSVLGDDIWAWLLPIRPPSIDGLFFENIADNKYKNGSSSGAQSLHPYVSIRLPETSETY